MDNTNNVKDLIEPILNDMSLVLYDICWRNEGKTKVLQIALMHEDGTIDMDTCCEVSQRISDKLDEADSIAFEYFLEVCSPGAERELRSDEEITKAIGEYVYVKLKNPKAGIDEVKGTLVSFENRILYMDYMAKAVKKKAEIEMDNVSLIRLSVKI